MVAASAGAAIGGVQREKRRVRLPGAISKRDYLSLVSTLVIRIRRMCNRFLLIELEKSCRWHACPSALRRVGRYVLRAEDSSTRADGPGIGQGR